MYTGRRELPNVGRGMSFESELFPEPALTSGVSARVLRETAPDSVSPTAEWFGQLA